MIVAASKVGNRYARALPAFQAPVELGVAIPLTDYKFLRSYRLYTLAADASSPISYLTLNEPVGGEIPPSFITDFDGKYPQVVKIGPGSKSGNDKGIICYRPSYWDAGNSRLYVNRDTEGNVKTVSASFLEDDEVLVAGAPRMCGSASMAAITRTPKMIGVSGHANTVLMANTEFVTEITAAGTIDPRLHYRFSFYYRISVDIECAMKIKILYYTRSGDEITYTHLKQVNLAAATADTEDSDFRFYQGVFPDPINGVIIPVDANRIAISIRLEALGCASINSILEIAYPVLETSYVLGAHSGFIAVYDAPDSISFTPQSPSAVSVSDKGSILSEDFSRFFLNHSNRILYEGSIGFGIQDVSIVNQLRMLEQLNSMGLPICLRVKHPAYPPVMIGNISINTTIPSYDFQRSDVAIDFTELI